MTVTYKGYKDSELEDLDAPFMPSYRPVAGAGAAAVVLGLGAWIRIYGPKLGRFLWEKAKELDKLKSAAVNKLKQAPKPSTPPPPSRSKSLQRNTMGDLSRLETNNPEAFKKVSPQIRKQYGKQKLDFKHKSSQQYQQSQSPSSDLPSRPTSKHDPTKGESTRRQSLLGPRQVFRLNKKKAKK